MDAATTFAPCSQTVCPCSSKRKGMLLHGERNEHPEPLQMFMLVMLLQVLWLQDALLLAVC